MFITPSVIVYFSLRIPFLMESLCKMMKELSRVPPILMKNTDGGTNQRNTLESVKTAPICLFKELDLDFMVATRCVLRHSYMNQAENIMNILNLGLQNIAMEWAPCDDESIDKKVKKRNSMVDLQEFDEKVSGV